MTFSSITVILPNLFFLLFVVGESGEVFKKLQKKLLVKLTEKALNSKEANKKVNKIVQVFSTTLSQKSAFRLKA